MIHDIANVAIAALVAYVVGRFVVARHLERVRRDSIALLEDHLGQIRSDRATIAGKP